MAVGGRNDHAARARERGTALLEEAVERSRPSIVAERLRANVGWLAQAALATAAAWVLAQQLFGHERPIFAPVAALIGVSASLGQRRRSAVEMVIGVALGIGIADALVVLIGTGPAQIAAVVCGAMVVAIAFGGSTALVGEAAASALLVVTIQLPGTGLSGVRFLDSLLGGIVAIAVTSLLPRNPVEAVHRAAAPLLGEIAGTLEDVARALERRDRELAERAWARSHGLRLAELDSAVAAGREMLRLAPFRGGTREQFARYEQAATQIRTALTSVEALSRGAVRALTVGDNVPAPVPDSLRDLAETVRTLDEYLDDPAGRPVVREPALRAAAQATLVLEQTANLSVSVIVAQVRSTAVDLIRGWGLAREEAERLVREAADRLATGEHASLEVRPRPAASLMHPRILRRVGVDGRAALLDGCGPQLVVPRLVAVDLAQPVPGAVLGQPRRGLGGPEVDRVPRHVSGPVGGGHPPGGLRFGAVLRDRPVEELLLVLRGAPAAVDVELDAVVRGIGCRPAQGAEQIGVENADARDLVVEDRRAVGDGAVSLAERTTRLTDHRALGDGTVGRVERRAALTARDVDGCCGRRGRGRRQLVAQGRGDRRDDGEQNGDADPADPDPMGGCSCWLAVGHAAIQGSGVLPARMWFSICRRYARVVAAKRTGTRAVRPACRPHAVLEGSRHER